MMITASATAVPRTVPCAMVITSGELKDRQYIGVDRYNIADITAQVALLTARGACGLPIPEDHRNLARWWGAVSKRPTARA